MFEEDIFADERERLNNEEPKSVRVEGPAEIADRMHVYTSVLKGIADEHHSQNPEKRLVVWAVGHGDNISPFIHKHVRGVPQKERYLKMEKNGGITIEVAKDGTAKTELSGREFVISFDSLQPDPKRERKSQAEIDRILADFRE